MDKMRWFALGALFLLCRAGVADWQTEKWNPFSPSPILGFGNLVLGPNYVPSFHFGSVSMNMLHVGAVDLMQEAGTAVYAVRAGVPSFPKIRPGESELSGWTATIQVLSDDGILTYYMHLDAATYPKSLLADISAGRSIAAGTFLGTIQKHSVLPSHVHFGAADCRHHVRLDPLARVDYVDRKPPVMSAIVAHRSGGLVDIGANIDGDVELTLFAHDEIEGLAAKFSFERLELEVIGPADKQIYSATVFDGARIPSHPVAADDLTCRFFGDYDGYETNLGAEMYRAGLPTTKGYAISLTGDATKAPAHLRKWYRPFPSPWRTKSYANGDYVVRVRATDAKGNSAKLERVFHVANPR